MAVPVACLHGTGLRAGRDQGRPRHVLDRHAEGAFRAGRPRRHPRKCREDNVHVIWTTGPGLLWPQRCRRLRHGCRGSRQGRRQAGAPAIHARPGHRLGSQGAGFDPSGARRDRCRGQRHRLRFPEQGLFPRRRRHQRQQAEGHAGRADSRRRAASRATASACRRNPTALPTSARPGRRSRRCSTALRRCAARICAIRSGRKSISPANRSWTKWPRRSNVDPVEFRLRYVKDPRDIAVIKAAAEKAGWQTRPSPRKDQTGDKVTGRGIAYAQRGADPRRGHRRGRCRSLDRQNLGAQVHGRA